MTLPGKFGCSHGFAENEVFFTSIVKQKVKLDNPILYFRESTPSNFRNKTIFTACA